jgi:broad specificity phosphatase PhoE
VQARDADIPLSPLGELQAAALGARLRDALPAEVALFSSPYHRALQTARIALGEQAPLRIDERLRDRELGVIDALTTLGVERRLPDEAARRRWVGKLYYRPPGGESWADLALRLRSFLRDLPPVETVAVFAHDAIVSVFLYVLLGMTEEELADFLLTRPVTNASVTALTQADDGRWSVDAFADDAHLAVAGLPATEHPGATRADA